MKGLQVLLVEPEYRRLSPSRKKSTAAMDAAPCSQQREPRDDATLWYPPLGLMKLARFHKDRGDKVCFVSGCDPGLFSQETLFSAGRLWDRVYITTLFTYDFKMIVKTIRFYREAVGGTTSKVIVGGIMASLMPDAIYEETGVYPFAGVVNSPSQIGLDGDTNIDLLAPDYDILDSRLYATNHTYYAYTTRGCVSNCPWCGVPEIEPVFIPYIDIKPTIRQLRSEHGDKPKLMLMDNNVLASPRLARIVHDLLSLGYGRGEHTDTQPKKTRVIDFNQGLDASFLTEKRIRLLSKLNIKPMRIAFDRVQDKDAYVRAVRLAHKYGFKKFSNYMLYNFKDSPRDLYDRLVTNIELNEEWVGKGKRRRASEIYSFPMRYAPIDEKEGAERRKRDHVPYTGTETRDWLEDPAWTKRFIRNVEIMKGAAHGAISPTPGLARRTIGKCFEEFLANLYMPEELLRNRNKHERRVYADEPPRKPGTGKVEAFRRFILNLLKRQNATFRDFHDAVSQNSVAAIRGYKKRCKNEGVKKWLELYLKK